MNSRALDSADSRRPLIDRVLDGRGNPADAGPATAVVLSHPGDEAISLSTLLPQLRQAQFIYIAESPAVANSTSQPGLFFDVQSAPAARKAELRAALILAGISGQRITLLGLKEGEVSWHIVWLAHRLTALFTVMKPEAVITHPYEGGHPDHDAAAMAVHGACARLRRAGLPSPTIIEAAAYHRGSNGSIVFGQFLPAGELEQRHVRVRVVDRANEEFRQQLVSCYSEQRPILGQVTGIAEAYREAPGYDFSAPPHRGSLLYEQLLPGCTGAHWRILARAAADRLRLPLCHDTPAQPAA